MFVLACACVWFPVRLQRNIEAEKAGGEEAIRVSGQEKEGRPYWLWWLEN